MNGKLDMEAITWFGFSWVLSSSFFHDEYCFMAVSLLCKILIMHFSLNNVDSCWIWDLCGLIDVALCSLIWLIFEKGREVEVECHSCNMGSKKKKMCINIYASYPSCLAEGISPLGTMCRNKDWICFLKNWKLHLFTSSASFLNMIWLWRYASFICLLAQNVWIMFQIFVCHVLAMIKW